MYIISRLKRKLHQSGVLGVVASALRHAANRLDQKLINDHFETKQTNEFLSWVRFAVQVC